MAREPWELTQAFAEQLMRQAAQTEQQATRVQMAPIEQAMALDRLKQQGELELAQLPRRLSIEDAARQPQENRAYTRQKETEERGEERTIAGEQRKEEALPRTLRAQTDELIRRAGGSVEEKIKLYQKYGKDYEKAVRADQRSSVVGSHVPETLPGHEPPQILPKDPIQAKMFVKDLEKQGFEVTKVEGGWGNNHVHFRKRVDSFPQPKKKEEVKAEAGPSLGRRLLDKITGSSEPPKAGAPPVAGAAPTADKLTGPPPPVSTRPAASLPFNSVGPADPLPASARSIPSMIGDTRLPLPEMKGDPIAGKDKMSFLYESIRRRGYNDDEAKTILANVINKPETKPTDDPDVFDVLVA